MLLIDIYIYIASNHKHIQAGSNITPGQSSWHTLLSRHYIPYQVSQQVSTDLTCMLLAWICLVGSREENFDNKKSAAKGIIYVLC